MQALYQIDLAGTDPAEALAHVLRDEDGAPEADLDEFARDLVEGVAREREALDALIERFSHHWRVERMARVDRNVLRLAAYELLHRTDVPTKVVLNEAIELAKRFGTEESGAFINGILDKVAASLVARRDTPK